MALTEHSVKLIKYVPDNIPVIPVTLALDQNGLNGTFPIEIMEFRNLGEIYCCERVASQFASIDTTHIVQLLLGCNSCDVAEQ